VSVSLRFDGDIDHEGANNFNHNYAFHVIIMITLQYVICSLFRLLKVRVIFLGSP